MHVESLWRYPVKSMIGETVDAIDLTPSGVAGDRQWATRDLERGGIRGAKKLKGLMRFRARTLEGGHAEITLPDGRIVTTRDPDVHDAVSAALGHRVALEALRPADDLEHYRRGPADTDDLLAELRAVFGREEHEPLPDLGVFPPEVIEFESPPGTYHDCWPLLIMTTSALEALRTALPGSIVDVARFRPSLVIATPDGSGHAEFTWGRRQARLGDAVVELLDPCPRCVMVTHEIDEGIPADRAVLRHVVAELDQNVGVYARVVTPGAVRVGDPFDII